MELEVELLATKALERIKALEGVEALLLPLALLLGIQGILAAVKLSSLVGISEHLFGGGYVHELLGCKLLLLLVCELVWVPLPSQLSIGLQMGGIRDGRKEVRERGESAREKRLLQDLVDGFFARVAWHAQNLVVVSLAGRLLQLLHALHLFFELQEKMDRERRARRKRGI